MAPALLRARVDAPDVDGDPGPIRTGDLPLRRGTLYPAELRGHWQLERIPRLAERTKRSKGQRQALGAMLRPRSSRVPHPV